MNQTNVQMLTDLLNHLSCGEPFPLAGADGVAEMVDASIIAEELAKRGVLNPAALTDDDCEDGLNPHAYAIDREALARIARGETATP